MRFHPRIHPPQHALPAPRLLPFSLFGLALPALGALSSHAHAAIPDPMQCTVESYIVASWTANPAPTGYPACGEPRPGYDVIVRDAIGAPVVGAMVSLHFAETSIRLYATQNPGTVVNCATLTLSRTSGPLGEARFVARFGGSANADSVRVTADGILLDNISARSPDLDGNGEVGLTDFGAFVRSYLSPPYEQETDYDGCPDNQLADLAFFAQEYLVSTNFPPEPLCP